DYSQERAVVNLQAANQLETVSEAGAEEQILLSQEESFSRLKSRQLFLAQTHAQQLHSAFAHKAAYFAGNILGDLHYADQRPLLPLAEESVNQPVLALGFSAGIKNTWLFSNETFLGLAGYNGHRTELSFVPDFALTLRYQVRPQWEVEAGLSFSSNVGQSYYQYIHGRFSRKDISLNYIHGEIMANYLSRRSWVVLQNTLRLNSTIGFYLAGLNNAFESIEGERFDVSHNYQSIDYGLILGQNVDIELPGNLTFSPGIRLSWGLPNIHERMPDLPEFMWKTLNRSLEFRLAVLYRVPIGNK
ncbi:MAG TPA: outer membrane beta-barrel protein, partial [Bacteroidales bacterium]|nr:outer membrane beta-barrel protein [Bacteroidales bacterium]